MRRGFTLVELMVVVTILAGLVSLGSVNYTKWTERTCAAEGMHILGVIRQAQLAYYSQWGVVANDINYLNVEHTSLQYFEKPDLRQATYDNTHLLGRMERNDAKKKGMYNYGLSIYVNGTIDCEPIGSGKCPPGVD